MLDWLFFAFRTPSARQMLAEHRAKAARDLTDHLKSAEYHGAMATMLRSRLGRIDAMLGDDKLLLGRDA